MSGFVETVRIQSTVMHAITLRSMHSRFVKSRFGFLLAILQPIAAISLLYVVRAYLMGNTTRHGVPLAVFLVTGYLVYLAFRNMAMAALGAAQQNSGLFAFARITPMDNILGEAVVVWMVYTCVNVLLSFMAVRLTGAQLPFDYLTIVVGFYGGMWFGLSLGIMLGVVIRYVPSVRYVIGPLMRVNIFISGVIFSAAEMPKWLLPYLAWNPLLHACEIVRQGWSSIYQSPVASPAYLGICCLITTALALTSERITRHFRFT